MRKATTMTEAARERLEMSGYASGRSGDSVCYRYHGWTEEQAAAFRKGYTEGRDFLLYGMRGLSPPTVTQHP
jgi:hypothetical protein